MNPVLGGDGDDSGHVGWAGFAELLGAAGEEDLEARWRGLHQHPQRSIAAVPEGMHDTLGREDDRPHRHFAPRVVLEKLRAPFQHHEPLVLVQMIMRRRSSARRRDVGEHRVLSSGFRTAQVHSDFVAKCLQNPPARRRDNDSGCAGCFAHMCGCRYCRRHRGNSIAGCACVITFRQPASRPTSSP